MSFERNGFDKTRTNGTKGKKPMRFRFKYAADMDSAESRARMLIKKLVVRPLFVVVGTNVGIPEVLREESTKVAGEGTLSFRSLLFAKR